MTDKDIAIKVENISKTFRIPHEKISSLRGAFVNLFGNKGYEEFKALDNVSFKVKKGEFFGIIGRNGSGKSTLLKILAGIYKPDEGRVKINGLISPFLELGIGFNPELSGRDNIYLNAAVLGLTHKQIDEKFDDIVRFSELKRFIDQKVKNYSSGMQVRLAFSVAIHANRDILLMDEVLAVGDANFQGKCLTEFMRYKKLGKTVILVTHDILTVQKYCDRAMLLREGKIQIVGNPEKVCSEYVYQNMTDEEKRLFKEETERRKREEETETERKEKEPKSILDSDSFRGGSKKAVIESHKILNHLGEETLSLKAEEKFEIILRVRFNESVDNACFGFMFKEQWRGGIQYGIHSYYSKKPLDLINIKKGTILEVVCAGQMILTPGLYFLSLSCAKRKHFPHYEDLDILNNMIKVNVYGMGVYWGSLCSNGVVTAKQLKS
jgi:ABC-2 type transport system ATP-binding protein